MPTDSEALHCSWFSDGNRVFAAMLQDIGQARQSVRLETYIFATVGIGILIRDALAAAARRGVNVQVLIDGFGSASVSSAFWEPLRAAGGAVRVFNPLCPGRFGIRNHRKLVVCDGHVSYVGGFNIAPEYEGDGVQKGWRDVALRIQGPLSAALASTFDRMFSLAAMRRKLLVRLRPHQEKRIIAACGCRVLLGGPGRGANPISRAFVRDLSVAASVRIMVAYFLPTRSLYRTLLRTARRGAHVEVLLPGISDVPMSKLATESLYHHMLRAGLKIHEYQPQMLHGKLLIVDNTVYVGSCNLDPRSLRVNYELMIRLESADIAKAAHAVFDESLGHCAPVRREVWQRSRSLWLGIKQRFAHFVMARLDPWIAHSQWKSLPK